MNIVELVAQFREQGDDDTVPYLWSDSVVVGLFNDAENEACRRKDLIFDSTTSAVCSYTITTASVTLHTSILFITKAWLVDSGGTITHLSILDRDELDRIDPLWRENTGTPSILLIDETKGQLTPPPTETFTLKLEVYRTPIAAMFLPVVPTPVPAPDPLIVSPEIAAAHHRYLHHWALHVAYSKRDVGMDNPTLAKFHEDKFSSYFGRRITADRKRSVRANRPHRNKVW